MCFIFSSDLSMIDTGNISRSLVVLTMLHRSCMGMMHGYEGVFGHYKILLSETYEILPLFFFKHRFNKYISLITQYQKIISLAIYLVLGRGVEIYWFCYGIKFYYFIMNKNTWSGCKTKCQNYSLPLLKIEDEDELVLWSLTFPLFS